jgi:hypothetical protein
MPGTSAFVPLRALLRFDEAREILDGIEILPGFLGGCVQLDFVFFLNVYAYFEGVDGCT